MPDESITESIQDCLDCHRTCLEAIPHVLKQGGKMAEASHVNMLLDCAAICRLAADFMIRGSDLHTRSCTLCVEITEMCARDCERFVDDPVMQRCAQACRRCAASCARTAGVAA